VIGGVAALRGGGWQEVRPVRTELIPSSFEDTVSARWWRRLAGPGPTEHQHWRTKTAYYAAVHRLFAGGLSRPAWFDVISAVQPKGSRSTFYEVTGAHAKHSLIDALRAQDAADSLQLVLYYQRSCAVDQLIDETKVWTYWPYREFLRARHGIAPELDPIGSVDLLASAIGEWARGNTGLAAALCWAPPVSAVEDLLRLQPGYCSPLHAIKTLREIIKRATA